MDGLAASGIPSLLRDFTAERKRQVFDGPVVFTLRLRRDGGAWDDALAPDRQPVWRSLPRGSCDFVDLEIEEIDEIRPETLESLRGSGIGILLSHHAFTPPGEIAAAPEDSPAYARWNRILDRMRAYHPAGVKIAVALDEGEIESRAQSVSLLHLARRLAGEYTISCVLGMGPQAGLTRLVSPLLGCPLTYGFMGDKPHAPGQLPVGAMRRFFQRARSESQPSANASAEEWLDWAAKLWAQVSHAA